MSSKPSKPTQNQAKKTQVSQPKPPGPSPSKKKEIHPAEICQFSRFDLEFEQHARNLSKHYSRFLVTRNDWSQPLTARKLFLKWLGYYQEKTEEELFRGKSPFELIANPENIYKAPDEKILFQNYNFLRILNASWPLRFDSTFYYFGPIFKKILRQVYSETD